MSQPITPEEAAELRRLFVECNGNATEVSRRTGRDREVIKKHVAAGGPIAKDTVARHSPKPKGEKVVPLKRVVRDNKNDGTREIEFNTFKPIKTEADALREAQVDTSVWYVKDFEITDWTVPMKLRQGEEPGTRRQLPDIAHQTQQYRIYLKLARYMPDAVREGILEFHRKAARPPKYPSLAYKAKSGEPEMAVACLFDVHYGKLALKPEASEDYDLKIASKRFRNGVVDLARRIERKNIARILFPIGNDFFHINSSQRNETASGTAQDTDGRYPKIIETGLTDLSWAIGLFANIAPMKGLLIPGNHGPDAEYHVALALAMLFKDHPSISIDYSSIPRKYDHWATNLLGFCHGDKEKHDSLPGLMANEMPQAWAASTCRQWFLGHQHHFKKYQTKPGYTHDGVQIQVIRSIAGTDKWHHAHSFINLDKAAEVFLFGEESGYTGHGIARARDD